MRGVRSVSWYVSLSGCLENMLTRVPRNVGFGVVRCWSLLASLTSIRRDNGRHNVPTTGTLSSKNRAGLQFATKPFSAHFLRRMNDRDLRHFVLRKSSRFFGATEENSL